jgi:hypothetical protein
MRIALLAALLLALPAYAQQQTVSAQQVFPIQSDATTLLATNDVVKLTISGEQWASVVWVVSTAGSGGITTEYTIDPRGAASGNWLASPYAKRLDQVSANPSVAVWANTTPVVGTYETPLPGNATAFRIRYQTAGTATVIQLSVGSFFTPGVPVRGVLFDVATTAGASNNTGAIDVSGWSAVAVDIVVTTAVTGAASLNEIDDTGAAVALGTSASIAVNTYAFGWGGAFTFGTTNPFTMKGAITSSPLPGRISIATAGATTSAQRIRVWGTR